MRKIFETFFAGLFFGAFFVSSAVLAQSSLRVVVFGDSLVSGYHIQAEQAYAARLEQKLREIGYTGVSVINMAAEGLTTATAMDRVSNVLDQQPDVIVMAFGTDDLARGVAVSQTYTNLAYITTKLSPPGSYMVMMGVKAPPSLGYATVKQFESMYVQVANLRRALLIPDIMQGISGNSSLTLADDTHPNDRGVDIMVESSYRYVDSCLRTKIQAIQYQQQYKAYQQNLVNP